MNLENQNNLQFGTEEILVIKPCQIVSIIMLQPKG
jgi:hypothetical protein